MFLNSARSDEKIRYNDGSIFLPESRLLDPNRECTCCCYWIHKYTIPDPLLEIAIHSTLPSHLWKSRMQSENTPAIPCTSCRSRSLCAGGCSDAVDFETWRLGLANVIQGSAKEWSLGCVKRAPVARGVQDAGITQPRDNQFFSRSLYS